MLGRLAGECIAALLAETSADWMISAQGALACGMTITTVYATLGHEAMLHGLVQARGGPAPRAPAPAPAPAWRFLPASQYLLERASGLGRSRWVLPPRAP